MDVKPAVATAKTFVSDLFAEEGVANLGLEEVERDEGKSEWRVTLGFSRPWDTSSHGFGIIESALGRPRSYKIVRVSDNGSVMSVTNK